MIFRNESHLENKGNPILCMEYMLTQAFGEHVKTHSENNYNKCNYSLLLSMITMKWKKTRHTMLKLYAIICVEKKIYMHTIIDYLCKVYKHKLIKGGASEVSDWAERQEYLWVYIIYSKYNFYKYLPFDLTILFPNTYSTNTQSQ